MDNKPANNYADWANGEDKPANMRQLSEKDFVRRSTCIMDEAMAEGLIALGIKANADAKESKAESSDSDDGAKKEALQAEIEDFKKKIAAAKETL